MKFSVIIPAHNEENTLGKCLESIKAQSFTDYEIIVVCDNCTDNTESVAMSYAVDKIIKGSFGNDGMARNAGLDVAKGKWVLFIDADDWYLHEFVFSQMENVLRGQKIDVLLYAIIWKHIGYVQAKAPDGRLFTHVTNKIWRREFIGDTRFPDKKVANDAGFQELMFKKNPRIAFTTQPFYYYNYLREGSKSDSLGRSVENTKRYWGI